jgi:hypothetical protein
MVGLTNRRYPMLKYKVFFFGSNYSGNVYEAYHYDAIPEDIEFNSVEKAADWLQIMNEQNRVDKRFNYVILPVVSL